MKKIVFVLIIQLIFSCNILESENESGSNDNSDEEEITSNQLVSRKQQRAQEEEIKHE